MKRLDRFQGWGRERTRDGAYRVRGGTGRLFAQLIRGRAYSGRGGWGEYFEDDSASRERPNGRSWRVEIRNTRTGDLVRHAGIFGSLDIATDEAIATIRREQ